MRKKSDLRPYQDRGVSYFYEHDSVLAIVGMGGGKTAMALTAIRELIDDGVIRCALVLAPKRVAQLVWTREHKEWEHLAGLKICHVAGSPDKRTALLNSDADIYVLGVDNTQWLIEILKGSPADLPLFDLLVIDEISRFKNPRSKRGKVLKKLIDRWKGVWGLTGTPRPNGYEDLFNPVSILTKQKMWGRSFDRWRTERFMPIDYNGYNWTIRPEWRERTIKDAGSISFTVRDEDMPELEPITKVFHWVDLPVSARAVYKDMERKLLASVDDKVTLAANKAVSTGKLAQIAQGFLYGEGGSEDVQHIHTAKSDMLDDLLEGVDGEPVLIGYEFIEEMKALKEMYGLPHFGRGTTDAQALQYEAAWNRRELPRLALHPASAGHGLNLQHGGSQFIWLCPPWSAEYYDQTRKRYHRPGQTRRCFEHFILARDTVDEMKYDRVVNKLSEQEAFRRYIKKL